MNLTDAIRPAAPASAVPPLEHGDRLTADEFERRRESMPDLKKAELIDGTVYLAHPQWYRQLDPSIPPLENGDRMTRAEFERSWENTPDLKKAELLDGVVFMAPPVSAGQHGIPHSDLGLWLGTYRVQTPGVEQATDSALRLPGDNDPQPDVSLFVLRDHGGSAWLDEKGYLRGTPNLVVEVAASTASYDRHQKLEVYRKAGIAEYLVHRTLDRDVDWFVLRDGQYQQIPGEAGRRGEKHVAARTVAGPRRVGPPGHGEGDGRATGRARVGRARGVRPTAQDRGCPSPVMTCLAAPGNS